MSTEDQKQMMEQARWLEQRQASPPTPHVHPDTVNDLERRIGAIEQHVRDQSALPPATDTVYAHVERTVHALLTRIEQGCGRLGANPGAVEYDACVLKMLAEAVQQLSSWPQFNPMNAVDDYRKIAKYEVGKAFRAYRAGAPLPACSCGVGVKSPEPWHYHYCSGRSYAR